MSTLAELAGTSSGAPSQLEVLTKKLSELLEKQRKVAEDVNRLLADPSDGLIENSRLVCRNLDAAVRSSLPSVTIALRLRYFLSVC